MLYEPHYFLTKLYFRMLTLNQATQCTINMCTLARVVRIRVKYFQIIIRGLHVYQILVLYEDLIILLLPWCLYNKKNISLLSHISLRSNKTEKKIFKKHFNNLIQIVINCLLTPRSPLKCLWHWELVKHDLNSWLREHKP